MILAGRYRLEEQIGAGGMGSVWRGRDSVLDRPVAVKLTDPALDAGFRGRFLAEARAAAGLSHRHIVTVHDYGEADGTPYIVMELLAGETLAGRLPAGPLPDAVAISGQVAAGLAAAHEAGIVHRDVKPANIFLTSGGAKILDFGIAFSGSADLPLGTPGYTAPEVVEGGPITPAVDVYGLGIVLFESLTGHRPADSELPPAHADLYRRCVATDPAERPTAASVAEALGEPVVPSPPPTPPSAPRSDTRLLPAPANRARPVILAGLAALAVVVALVGFGLHHQGGSAPPQTSPTTPAAPSAPRPVPSAGAPSAGAPSAGGTAIDALTRMRRTVDEGSAAGQVRSDVAVDFDNLITALLDRLAAGQEPDLPGQVSMLHQKIITRLGEGGLTQAKADELTAELSSV